MSGLEHQVKAALASTLQIMDASNIKNNQNLKRDLRLDSMSSLMFLMRLEETIEGFFVDPETLRNSDLDTVDSVIQYVDLQLDINRGRVH